MKGFQKQPHTFKKICSKAATQNIHTLREDFQNLSIVIKTSMMDG